MKDSFYYFYDFVNMKLSFHNNCEKSQKIFAYMYMNDFELFSIIHSYIIHFE